MCALRSCHPLEGIGLRGLQHSCFCNNRLQYWILLLQATARLLAPGECAVVGFGSPAPCVLPLARAAHPPVPSLFVSRVLAGHGSDSIPGSQSKVHRCHPPASQCPASQFVNAPYVLGSREETSLLLVVPQHQFVATSLGSGPPLLLCMVSFFPRADPAGLWPDTEITCLCLSLSIILRGEAHIPAAVLSDATVCSLMDAFSWETCLG